MTKLHSPWLVAAHLFLVGAGAIGLASSVAAWPETFLFGKVFRLPEFARGLSWPWPITFQSAWILLFLLGPALTAPNIRWGSLTLVGALTAGAAFGVPWHSGQYGTSNYLFNVGWVAIFLGLKPLIVSVLLMLAAMRIRHRRGHGRSA